MQEPYLGSREGTARVLKKYGFSFRKKYGQNFLIDGSVLEGIVEAAGITEDDFVLEIGPGIGTMTQYLCEHAGKVMAVEIDKIATYTDQPAITRHDIDAVVIPVMEAEIYHITDAVRVRDFDLALQKMRSLLLQEFEPIVLNAAIGRQLRQLYAAKTLSEHGKGPYDLMQLCGIKDTAAQRLYNQASGFKKDVLKQGIRLSADTDYAMKTSGGDSGVLLEMMLLRLAEMSGGSR